MKNQESSSHQNKEGEPKKEIFWTSVKESAEDFFEKNIREKYSSPDYGPEKIAQKKIDAVLREQIFVESFISEAERAKEENPGKELLILLDIDETIGILQFNEDGKLAGTMLRPSIIPLLEYAQREFPHVKYGFITTRGKEKVTQQLQDAKHLKSLSEYISPEQIYSTEDYKTRLSKQLSEQLNDDTKDPRQIMQKIRAWEHGLSTEEEIMAYLRQHPEVEATKIPTTIERWVPGDYRKLEIIKSLREQNSGMALIAIDDFEYPTFMKYGICVYPQSMFTF